MKVWAHRHLFGIVLAGAQIYRSAQRPALSAVREFAVPGAESSVDAARHFENIALRETPATTLASTSENVASTSGKKGKGLFCGGLGCLGKPEVEETIHPPHIPTRDEPHHIYSSVREQRAFLKSLRGGDFETRPRAQNLLNQYKNSARDNRVTLLQKAFLYLGKANGMALEEVGAWIELFTVMARDRKQSILEGTNILYGLHSLSAKYAHDPQVSQYAETAIGLIKPHLLRPPDLTNLAREPWIKEMLRPEDGLSQDFRNYEKLKKTVRYDLKLLQFFPLIEDGKTGTILEKLPELELSIIKDTPEVSAQSKTAAIAILYHISKLSGENMRSVAQNANEILLRLQQNKGALFPHDAKLIDALSGELKKGSFASTSHQ